MSYWLSLVTFKGPFKEQVICFPHFWGFVKNKRQVSFSGEEIVFWGLLLNNSPFSRYRFLTPSMLKILWNWLSKPDLQQHKDIKGREQCDIYFWFVKNSTVQQSHIYITNLKHREQPKHFLFHLNGTWRQFCESSPDVLLVQSAGWESSDLQEQFGIGYYLRTTNQTCPLSSTQTLTVKDLLLSNLRQTVRREELNVSVKKWHFVKLSNQWGY